MQNASPVVQSDANTIVLTSDDKIRWNGVQITLEQLQALLAQTAAMGKEPDLELYPDASAGYETSAAILRVIKQSGVTKFSLVGNEKYRVR